jgi:hypothetical protein
MRALNLKSDGAGVGSPGGTNLLPSTRITQETEGKKILGLAQEGERLEQFLYRNVLIAVTVQQDSKCLSLHMNLNRNITIKSESREGQAHIVPLT